MKSKWERVTRFFDLHEDKIKKTVKFGSMALGDAHQILGGGKRPDVLGCMTLAVKVKGHYDSHFRSNSWHRFAKEWDVYTSHPLSFPLVRLVNAKFRDQLIVLQNSRVFVHENFLLAWHVSSQDEPASGIYVDTGNAAAASAFFNQLIWNTYSRVIHVERRKEIFNFIHADESEIFEAALATQYAEELGKYHSRERSRSILFYGPPGTGKSNIVKKILEILKLPTLRISYKDLQGLALEDTIALLNSVQPDAVVVEDIDHEQDGGANILHILETLRNRKKIVIMTANVIGHLTDASVRCGRFGRLVEVTELDENVLKRLVGDDAEIMEIVRKFPVSAIAEVLERVEVLGREKALADLDDIKKRVEAAQENYAAGKNSTLEVPTDPKVTKLNRYVPSPLSEGNLHAEIPEVAEE